MSKKEVLVVGFGAVGIVYSFILKRGGKANITCVARGNFEVTQASGVHIQSRTYGDNPGWKPDRLFKTVAEAADRPYSYVVVTTKALPDVAPTHSLLAPLLSPGSQYPLPTFVILQNGLSVEKDLYDAIKQLGKGEPNIISTAVWIGTNLQEGNIVEHTHPERLYLGKYRPRYQPDVTNTPEENTLLHEFAHLFDGSDSEVHVLDEVQKVKFRKNFWNAAWGTCATLTQTMSGLFLEPIAEEHVIPSVRAIMLEILAVGRAMGFGEEALPSNEVDKTIETTTKLYNLPNTTHRPSMLVDFDLGRPMEVEVIIGELVRRAKELRVDIPRLELIYTLLSVIQRQFIEQYR